MTSTGGKNSQLLPDGLTVTQFLNYSDLAIHGKGTFDSATGIYSAKPGVQAILAPQQKNNSFCIIL